MADYATSSASIASGGFTSEHWLERNEDAGLLTAYDRLKSFPEHPPIEAAG